MAGREVMLLPRLRVTRAIPIIPLYSLLLYSFHSSFQWKGTVNRQQDFPQPIINLPPPQKKTQISKPKQPFICHLNNGVEFVAWLRTLTGIIALYYVYEFIFSLSKD